MIQSLFGTVQVWLKGNIASVCDNGSNMNPLLHTWIKKKKSSADWTAADESHPNWLKIQKSAEFCQLLSCRIFNEKLEGSIMK